MESKKNNELSSKLEKCNLKPDIKFLKIDKAEYLIADKCFFPKNPDEFNQIINDFTFNPDDFLYYPADSSYSFDNGKISFKDSKDNITTYNYIPVCIVSGNVREINNSKVASLLWSWNKNSLSISPNHTLKQKNNHNHEINMDLIEAQPILDDKLIKKQPVLEPNSDEELEKSYDFMDSD